MRLLSMIVGGKQTAPADEAVPAVIRASIHRITVLFEQVPVPGLSRLSPSRRRRKPLPECPCLLHRG